jgi:predicted DCC family thiol-disulfide oxidoreductase YuxK
MMVTTEVDPRQAHSPAIWEIEVFYDGDCPLCMREIRLLRRIDRRGKIRFTNIATEDFRADDYGIDLDEFMAEIHGRLPDGTWVRGVEVFRRLYSAVGCGPIVWLTRLPVIRGLLDGAYSTFARNRLRWTGRCSSASSCQYEPGRAGESQEPRKRQPIESTRGSSTNKLVN